MKEVTAILLIVIALIGIISIIIVKLYYREKEKDEDKERLEEFLKSSDYNSHIESHESINSRRAPAGSKTVKNIDPNRVQRRRVRKVPKESGNAHLSEAQIYANTLQNASNEDLFGDHYNEGSPKSRSIRRVQRRPVNAEATQANSTATLLRQRAEAAKNASRQAEANKVRQVKRAKTVDNVRKVPRTPERVKEQMNKEEEVKSFQEPITKMHKETINSVNQGESEVKARQVPMTKEQKEFISSETAKKLIVEDEDGDVKIVKSIKPDEKIEEIKETAKIETAEETTEEAEETKVAETAKETTEEKAKAPKVEETKVTETTEEKAKAPKVEETKVTETTEEKAKAPKVEETKVTETTEEKAKAPKVEETKIAETTEEKAETPKVEETKIAETTDEKAKAPKVEETKPVEETPLPDEIYQDDLHILLGKEEVKEEGPENEFVTINSDNEESSGNDIFRDAIKSIRNFRGTNTTEQAPVKEIKEEVAPEDYIHDFGNGIEEIGDTITITPIHEEEEEPRDLAYNQPNENVDDIYKEINDESYNKTIDEELDKSYEDVSDETSEKDANVYTKEDYIKTEKAEEDKKIRAENTKKILNLKGEGDKKSSKAKRSERSKTRKAPSDSTPDGQKRLVLHEARSDVEEVYINGTLYELKVGQTVMFNHNNETYSSRILRLKPGYVGVKYRSKKVWIKATNIKKIF